MKKSIIWDWLANPYFIFLLGLFSILHAHLFFVGMESDAKIFQTRTAQGVIQYFVLDVSTNIVPIYVCGFLIYISKMPLKQKIQVLLFALVFLKDLVMYLMTSNYDYASASPQQELQLSIQELKVNAIILLSGILILEIAWKVFDYE